MRSILFLLAAWTSLSCGLALANDMHLTPNPVLEKASSEHLSTRIDPQCRATFYAARNLRYDLRNFAGLVSRYVERSQLEFAILNAERAVAGMQYQAFRDCDFNQLSRNLERVRERLDVVRRLYREDAQLTAEPVLFEAFRSMVYSWETLRDSIIL